MSNMETYADLSKREDAEKKERQIKSLKSRIRKLMKPTFTENERSVIKASLENTIYIARNSWCKEDIDDAKAVLRKLRD